MAESDLAAEIALIRHLAMKPDLIVQARQAGLCVEACTFPPLRSLVEVLMRCVLHNPNVGRLTLASELQHNNTLKPTEIARLQMLLNPPPGFTYPEPGMDWVEALTKVIGMYAYREGTKVLRERLAAWDRHPLDFQVEVTGLAQYLMRLAATPNETGLISALPQVSTGPVSTGYAELDLCTAGGYTPGLWMLVMPSEGGKSTTMVNLMANLIRAGRHVVCFSPEMHPTTVRDWTLSCLTGLSVLDLSQPDRLSPADRLRLESAQSQTSTCLRLFSQVRSIDQLEATIATVKSQVDGVAAVFYDHLGYLLPGPRERGGSGAYQVDSMAYRLQSMANSLQVCIVMLAQMSPEGLADWRKHLYTDRDSSRWGQGPFIASDIYLIGGRHNGLDKNKVYSAELARTNLYYQRKNRRGSYKGRFALRLVVGSKRLEEVPYDF